MNLLNEIPEFMYGHHGESRDNEILTASRTPWLRLLDAGTSFSLLGRGREPRWLLIDIRANDTAHQGGGYVLKARMRSFVARIHD